MLIISKWKCDFDKIDCLPVAVLVCLRRLETSRWVLSQFSSLKVRGSTSSMCLRNAVRRISNLQNCERARRDKGLRQPSAYCTNARVWWKNCLKMNLARKKSSRFFYGSCRINRLGNCISNQLTKNVLRVMQCVHFLVACKLWVSSVCRKKKSPKPSLTAGTFLFWFLAKIS